MSWTHILLFFSPFIAFDLIAHITKHHNNQHTKEQRP